MRFNLLIFEGTDIIKFGMTREEVSTKLQKKPELFKKSENDFYEAENYKNICHVYYEQINNEALVCAAIEFIRPSQVFWEDIKLLGEKRKKVEPLFNTKFEDCISDVSGGRSKKYDIAFYAPYDVIESIFIARKGYTVEQEQFYKEAFETKYPTQQEIIDITMRKRLCSSCMSIMVAKDGDLCPKCKVLLL